MKTSWTISSAAFVLAISLLASKADAHGGHSMGSSGANHVSNSFSSFNSTNHSNNFVQKTNLSTATNHVPSTTFKNNLTQLGNSGKQNSLSNFNKLNKIGPGKVNVTTFSGNTGGKGKSGPGKCCPGKCGWWGCGFGCCGSYGCCDYCCYDWCPSYCYCDPCYTSCYNVCYEYCQPVCTPSFSPVSTPTFTAPVTRIAHIVNPAETQATLGFAVNGQSYTLEAGKAQDLEVNEGAVIEFDRGGEDQTGRYSLSEGVYRFGSTPNGWELFHASDASAGDVASN